MATNATINHLAFHGTGYELVNDTLNVTVFSSQGTAGSIPSYNKASTSQDGLMSKEDKTKLDNFKTADQYVTVVGGKDLSTNDFTSAYKQQLDDLASNPPTVDTSQLVTKTELQTAIDNVTVDTSELVTEDQLQTAINESTVDTSNFVQKDGTKVLSDVNYTQAEKTKLEGIAENAQVNTIESIQVDGTALPISNKAVNIILSGKVDTVAGKQLSTNDFTNDYKNKIDGATVKANASQDGLMSKEDYSKLSSIEAGANKYSLPKATSASLGGVKIVEGNGLYMDGDTLKVNVTEAQGDFSLASTVASGLMSSSDKKALESLKAITDATTVKSGYMSTSDKIKLDGIDTLYATKSEVSSAVASVYKAKGSVNSFNDLPSNASEGDVYNIKTAGGTDVNGNSIKAGDNVVKVSNGWDVLAGTVDLTGYATTVLASTSQNGLMSSSDKTKLNGIANGAQVNTIEQISLNGSAVTPTDKGVNISNASTTASGLMSSSDKQELNDLVSVIDTTDKILNLSKSSYGGTITATGSLIGGVIDLHGDDRGGIIRAGGNAVDNSYGGTIDLNAYHAEVTNLYDLTNLADYSAEDYRTEFGIGGEIYMNGAGASGIGGSIHMNGLAAGGTIELRNSGTIDMRPNGTIKGDVQFDGTPHFNQSATGISLQSGNVNIPTDTYDSIMGNFTLTGNETELGYTLPTASPTVKGGIKTGTGLVMSDESLNVRDSLTLATVAGNPVFTGVPTLNSGGAVKSTLSIIGTAYSNSGGTLNMSGTDRGGVISISGSNAGSYGGIIDLSGGYGGTIKANGIGGHTGGYLDISGGQYGGTIKASCADSSSVLDMSCGRYGGVISLTGGTVGGSIYLDGGKNAGEKGGTISATGNQGGVLDLSGTVPGSIKGSVVFTDTPTFKNGANGISYTLPTASQTVKGGVMVGKALKMTNESIGVDALEADDVYITTSDLDSIMNQFTVGSAAPAGYFKNEITVTGGFNVPDSVSSSFGNYDTITFGNNIFIEAGNVTVTNGTSQYVTFAKNVKFNSGIKVGDSMSVDIGAHGSLVSDYADVDLRHSYIKVGLATVSGDPVFLNKISFNAGFNTANTVSSSFGTHSTVTATNSNIDLSSSDIHVANATVSGKPTFNTGYNVADSMKTSFGKYDTIDVDNYSKLNLQNNSSLVADNSFVNLTNSELKFNSATVSGNPVFTGTPTFLNGANGLSTTSQTTSGGASSFSSTVTLNGGFVTADSVRAGFGHYDTVNFGNYNLINVSNRSTVLCDHNNVDLNNSKMIFKNATISGSPVFTGTPQFDNGISTNTVMIPSGTFDSIMSNFTTVASSTKQTPSIVFDPSAESLPTLTSATPYSFSYTITSDASSHTRYYLDTYLPEEHHGETVLSGLSSSDAFIPYAGSGTGWQTCVIVVPETTNYSEETFTYRIRYKNV